MAKGLIISLLIWACFLGIAYLILWIMGVI
jgi:hypothetical protein